MKKLILSIFVISALCSTAFFAEAGYDNSNSRSRKQKVRDAKEQCKKMTDHDKVEACLKEIEEKHGKKTEGDKEKD